MQKTKLPQIIFRKTVLLLANLNQNSGVCHSLIFKQTTRNTLLVKSVGSQLCTLTENLDFQGVFMHLKFVSFTISTKRKILTFVLSKQLQCCNVLSARYSPNSTISVNTKFRIINSNPKLRHQTKTKYIYTNTF